MSLNPNITKDMKGVYWLNWTPDGSDGYAIVTPTGASRTFSPTASRSKLGSALTEPFTVSIRPLRVTPGTLEQASYPAAVPPPPPPGDPGMRDCSRAAWLRPLANLTVKEVRSLSEYQAAVNALPSGGGTLIRQKDLFTVPLWDMRRRFTGRNAVEFLDGTATPATAYTQSSLLSVFGLGISSTQSHGWHMSGCQDVQWWGARIHDVAATGVLVHANVGACVRMDLDADITRCGQDLSHDPHAEKGTGLHPFYIGSDDVGGAGVDGKFSFTAHDCPTGAGQIGNKLHDSTLWIDARRLTFVAHQQVGGNAAQLWGGGNRNLTFRRVYGEDLAGRVVETDGLDSTSGVVFEWARGVRCRLQPLYTAHSGVTYKDVG